VLGAQKEGDVVEGAAREQGQRLRLDHQDLASAEPGDAHVLAGELAILRRVFGEREGG